METGKWKPENQDTHRIMFEDTPLQDPVVGQRRSLDTRRKIMTAAAEIFSKEGFKGSSTRSIADAAGVMNSIINYHFGTKKDLWIEVVSHLFLKLRAVGDTCVFNDGEDVEQQFREHVHKLTRYIVEHPELFRIILAEATRGDSLLELIGPQIENYTKFTRRYFQQAQEHGICSHIPVDDFHAMFQSSLVTRFIYGYETKIITGLSSDDPKIVESHVDSMVKLFLGKR